VRRGPISSLASNLKAVPYAFISPFFVLFGIFMIWPIFYSFWMSFFDFKGIETKVFAGIANYTSLFRDTRFLRALLNTSIFAAGMVFLSVFAGFLLSLVLNSRATAGRNIFRLMFFLPILTSTIVAGAVFKLIFLDTSAGLLNHLLGLMGGLPKKWLFDDVLAIQCVIVLGFWRRLGLNIMYFIAGLQGLDPELYEAAVIDGAGPTQQLRYLTVPLMRPIIAFVVTITLIYAYLAFDEVFVLSPLGAMESAMNNIVTLGYFLYETAFQRFKFGLGAATGFVMTLIIMVLSLIQLKLLGVFKSE